MLALLLMWLSSARVSHAEPEKLFDAVPSSGDKTVELATGHLDRRFRSPKATVRWFLANINAAEENPDRIEDAVACLDLSALPPERREGGRLAFELERVLRWTEGADHG